MSKLDLFVNSIGYDGNSSTNCDNTLFKKQAQYLSINVDNYESKTVEVASMAVATMFNIAPSSNKLIYLESTGEINISVNGVAELPIKPIIIGTQVKNGIFIKSGDVQEVIVENLGLTSVTVSYMVVKG